MLSLCFLYAFFMLSLCFLYAFSMLSLCFLYAFSMFSLCFLNACSMLSLCFHYALSMLSLCVIYAFSMRSLCVLYASMLSLCFLYALSMFSQCFLYAFSMLSLCFLNVFSMFSLCVHYAFSMLSLCFPLLSDRATSQIHVESENHRPLKFLPGYITMVILDQKPILKLFIVCTVSEQQAMNPLKAFWSFWAFVPWWRSDDDLKSDVPWGSGFPAALKSSQSSWRVVISTAESLNNHELQRVTQWWWQ